ncbi:MAG TPA: arginase [Trueperaceae bacterium]|nr:arginase [Trueperaceae bacterium]
MADIKILGVPMDLGAGRRGVDMGPSALRLAKIAQSLEGLGHKVSDLGNVEVPIFETSADKQKLPYAEVIAKTCKNAYEILKNLDDDSFPLVLGGDHSIAMGSVAGVASKKRTGLLWIDAHSDVNTPETSPSGNIHGMPLSHLLGFGDKRLLDIWGGKAVINPKDVIFIGLRSVDAPERQFIRDNNLKVYTMKEIDKRGMAEIAEEAINYLSNLDALHVSFDADGLDPSIAPGVGTPVRGGLNYREAHLLMELLADAEIVTSLDIVEVNPILDVKNKTAELMVEMLASLLGKEIL